MLRGLFEFFSLECDSGVFNMSPDVWRCFSWARTSIMSGLSLETECRHCKASAATAWACFFEYWPPNLESIILNILLLSPSRNGFAQSTKLSSPPSPSISPSFARFPDSNSNSTTPKLYTSLFGVKWPALLEFDSSRKIKNKETLKVSSIHNHGSTLSELLNQNSNGSFIYW